MAEPAANQSRDFIVLGSSVKTAPSPLPASPLRSSKWRLVTRLLGTGPQATHTKAAESHEAAAKSHRAAAEHFGNCATAPAQEHSGQAMQHADTSHKLSKEAHGRTTQHASK
jgi:hypothetical protein